MSAVKPVRVTVVGSHGTGKSTLVGELSLELPQFQLVDEPYHLLADDGQGFSDPPTADDYRTMFDYACELAVRDCVHHTLFDRTAVDYLAYLIARQPGGDWRELISETADVLATFDLAVFVPIENPDRVAYAEFPKLRRRVDQVLREMLIERSYEFACPVVEVHGSTAERVQQVLAHLPQHP